MFIHSLHQSASPQSIVVDEWSGRYFESSMDEINQALLELNRFFVVDGEVDLNTFYDRLGLPTIPMGSSFGWSAEGGVHEIYIDFSAHIAPNNQPALTVRFRPDPKPEMGR